MARILAVNGIWYNVNVPVDGLSRDVSILDGPNAERLLSGGINLDTIGTFYNYSIKAVRDADHFDDYDKLHKVLRNPATRKKIITVPFDQSFITYEAYVSGVTDSLARISGGGNYWDGMTIKFTATDPNEVP